jgi:hypothetical protein
MILMEPAGAEGSVESRSRALVNLATALQGRDEGADDWQ